VISTCKGAREVPVDRGALHALRFKSRPAVPAAGRSAYADRFASIPQAEPLPEITGRGSILHGHGCIPR
jgi:hypothetical protein